MPLFSCGWISSCVSVDESIPVVAEGRKEERKRRRLRKQVKEKKDTVNNKSATSVMLGRRRRKDSGNSTDQQTASKSASEKSETSDIMSSKASTTNGQYATTKAVVVDEDDISRPNHASAEAYKPHVEKALAHMKSIGINFLALDFDRTILNIHTGGKWRGDWKALAHNVRPMFHAMIPAALEQNFCVAVVTFSWQTELVRTVLIEILNQNEELALTIPIRGGGGDWVYNGTGSREGKQAHMASAAEELEQRWKRTDITKMTTVLIDDDAKNIRAALKNGVRAIWLNPNRPNQVLNDMNDLV